jgi:hypothetical protein
MVHIGKAYVYLLRSINTTHENKVYCVSMDQEAIHICTCKDLI